MAETLMPERGDDRDQVIQIERLEEMYGKTYVPDTVEQMFPGHSVTLQERSPRGYGVPHELGRATMRRLHIKLDRARYSFQGPEQFLG